MKRKGDAELQILAVCLLLALLIQLGFMVASPSAYKAAVHQQISDTQPLLQTDIITAHMEEGYLYWSVTNAVHQGMYDRGTQGFGPWSDEPPTWDEVSGEFDTAITGMMQDNYAGILGSGADCTLQGTEDMEISTTDDETVFSVETAQQLHAECSSRHFGFGGAIQTVIAQELIRVEDEYEVPYLRYQEMHTVAEDIATDDTFRDLLDVASRSATTATITGCPQESSTECTMDAPDLSGEFDANHDIVNQQEHMIGDRLDDELHDALQDAYAADGFEITFDVEVVELTPVNIEEVQHEEWLIDCAQSDSDTYTVYPDDDGCGGSCPDSGECSLDDGADCFDDCPGLSGVPRTEPDPPSSTGSFWTENPWSADCGFTYGSWYDDYDGPESDVAYSAAETYPPDIRTSYTMHRPNGGEPVNGDDDDDDDNDVCEPSCPESEESCYEYLYTESNTRASWTFDLEASTVVTVTITDTENEIPTGDGLTNPEYRFAFEQGGTDDGTVVDTGDPEEPEDDETEEGTSAENFYATYMGETYEYNPDGNSQWIRNGETTRLVIEDGDYIMFHPDDDGSIEIETGMTVIDPMNQEYNNPGDDGVLYPFTALGAEHEYPIIHETSEGLEIAPVTVRESCPDGQSWNGEECTNMFNLVAVPLNYPQERFKDFYTFSQRVTDNWLEEHSPLRHTYSNPRQQVKLQFLEPVDEFSYNGEGPYPLSDPGTDVCWTHLTRPDLRDIAEIATLDSQYRNTYDRIMGIYAGDTIRMIDPSELVSPDPSTYTESGGCATVDSDMFVFTDTGDYTEDGITDRGHSMTHELGHAFGLCHMDGAVVDGECDLSESPDSLLHPYRHGITCRNTQSVTDYYAIMNYCAYPDSDMYMGDPDFDYLNIDDPDGIDTSDLPYTIVEQWMSHYIEGEPAP